MSFVTAQAEDGGVAMSGLAARVGAAALSDSERTPRRNEHIRQRLADFGTIADGLDYAALGDTGFNFYSSRGALTQVLPYSELRSLALSSARKLISAGLKPGDRVGIVAETGADFMAVFFGCQYAGLIPCPIPYSMHIGGKEAYIARVAGMLRAAAAIAVVTTAEMESAMGEASALSGTSMVLTHAQLNNLSETIQPLQGFAKDDVAYIQYSSGSTSDPKGVLITQRSIMANARGILRDGLGITKKDRAFSWLPLYHDMGLVGFCLSPMLGQVTVDYLATTAFARRPALWLRLMSQNKSTICFSPTFGYDLAARRIKGDVSDINLSSIRIAGIGGDMIRSDVLQHFAKVMAPTKFNASTFLPSYGMAESTLAISFSAIGEPLLIDHVSRHACKVLGYAQPAQSTAPQDQVRSFVVCGKALPGHSLEARNEQGKPARDREIGRIFAKGPSLMAGYFNNDGATASVLGEDGSLDTGDMGYMLDGRVVITGRAKDLILHNGRNIWPQDIEWATEKLPDLRSGDVAAFAVENENGEDDVVVLVECRASGQAEREQLRRNVGKIVHQSAGVDCRIVLVPPRSLPFTSSGKLSRASARQKFVEGEIADIEALESPGYMLAAQ
jgi:fatty-acyl-CoA synthase